MAATPNIVVKNLIVSNEETSTINDETKRMLKLIGKPLTRIEIRDGNVYLEFDPFGCITVIPRMTVEVVTSVNAKVI